MKLVSVIIPTYKRSDMLDNAIDSVLKQTYSEIEIIVVDDNNPNTDERLATEKKMLKYSSNPRVKYIKHEKNKNGSAARNTGIKAAQGEYICFLDDDDCYYPEKTQKEVDYLNDHKNYDGVYCWREDISGITAGKYDGDISEILLADKYMPGTTTLMFRRDVFKNVLFDESFRRHQEVEFLIRFCEKYKIGHIEYIGVKSDISDRRNVLHGKDLEKNKKLYIDTFRNKIESIKKKNRQAGSEIYIHHYVDIIADHVQNGYIGSAFKYFMISCKESFPLTIYKMIDHVRAYIRAHKGAKK